MKKLLLGFAALLTVDGAYAADLAYYKARPVSTAPISSWTGFYAGLNAGYGFGANGQDSGGQTYYSNTSGDTGTETNGPGGPAWNSRSNLSGFVGGAQLGYNQQIGSWVLGVETDFQGSNLSGSSSVTNVTAINLLPFPERGPNLWPVSGTETTTEKINWYGTLRGRVGVTTMHNSLLVYGTGGLAYGSVQQTFNYSGGFLADTALGFGGSNWNGTSSVSETKVGYTVGGGIEWKPPIWTSWSVKVEYLYTNLGSTTVNLTAPAFRNSNGTGGRSVSATNSMEDQFQTIRLGLNYHLN